MQSQLFYKGKLSFTKDNFTFWLGANCMQRGALSTWWYNIYVCESILLLVTFTLPLRTKDIQDMLMGTKARIPLEWSNLVTKRRCLCTLGKRHITCVCLKKWKNALPLFVLLFPFVDVEVKGFPLFNIHEAILNWPLTWHRLMLVSIGLF